MAARLTMILALLPLATPASATAVDRWHAQIEHASARFAIPAAWIRAVMQAESGGQLSWRGRPIVSRAGAMGLMQLMPGTWDEMRRRHGLGRDPFDPTDNILAGAAYLREMYDRFGYHGMLAAYNAGPNRYLASLRTRRPLPAETRAYVHKIGGMKKLGVRPAAAVRENPRSRPTELFVAFGTESRLPDRPGLKPSANLFAIQPVAERANEDEPRREGSAVGAPERLSF